MNVHIHMRSHQAYSIEYEELEKSKRKPSDDWRSIEWHFSKLTGLPIPKRNTLAQRKKSSVRWWSPIKEIYSLADNDVAAAKGLVSDAVKRMREDNLTISAPQSILNVALDIYAKNKSHQGVQAW